MGGTANEKEKELGYQPVAGNPANLENPVEPLPCWTAFTAGHVLVDGSLTACCMDGLGRWIMGDLKTQSFMDAWNSKEFQALRREHLNKNVIGTKCERCALVG
jgi:radical SAM protein with 4Fe4S-binding SPASM domain